MVEPVRRVVHWIFFGLVGASVLALFVGQIFGLVGLHGRLHRLLLPIVGPLVSLLILVVFALLDSNVLEPGSVISGFGMLPPLVFLTQQALLSG